MGIIKKAKRLVKKGRKKLKKLIPKEIRPALPFIAAAYLGPGAQGIGSLTGKELALKAAIAGGTRFASDDEADLEDVLRTSALAVTPDVASAGLGELAPKFASQGTDSGIFKALSGTKKAIDQAANYKTIGVQTGIDAAAQLAEINQDALDEYNRKLAEQGITDAKERRSRIRDIYLGVGYDEDYVDGLLDRYGYKSGGSTYTMEDILNMASDLTKKKRKEEEEEDEDELGYFLEQGQK